MKKRMLIAMVAVLLIISTLFVACDAFGSGNNDVSETESTDSASTTQSKNSSSKSNNDKVEKTVTSVVLSKTTVSLGVGETETLAAFASPDDVQATFQWSSTNESVATVSEEGVVTGVAKGTAVIKVKAESVFALCNVTVIEKTGSVTGTVTYKYNNYVGNKPDTDSIVYLISKKVESLPDSIALGGTYNIPEGCFATKVDGTGKYQIDNVPIGDYVAVLLSKNTNSGSKSGSLYWGYSVYNKFSEKGKEYADTTCYLQKIEYKNITVEADKTVTFSHDFGITYI